MQVYKKSIRKLKIVSEPIEGFNSAKITNSNDSVKYLRNLHPNIDIIEHFTLLLLNKQNNIMSWIHISSGGIDGAVVDPRLIFKYAIEDLATNIILCHNHPSGTLRPSQADIDITKNVINVGKLLQITVLDHIILTPESYLSFADEGLM